MVSVLVVASVSVLSDEEMYRRGRATEARGVCRWLHDVCRNRASREGPAREGEVRSMFRAEALHARILLLVVDCMESVSVTDEWCR